MKKAIIITITILLISFIMASCIYQTEAQGLGAIGDPSAYVNGGGDNAKAVKLGNLIVGIIRRVGETTGVVMLMIIGIKYIFGSVEEKAEYKKTMWPYILGAVLIFAGSAFTNMIYQMITGTT